VQRQRQQSAAGVIAPSRDLHDQMLSGVDPVGSGSANPDR
jgi:hypothetical protein